MAEKIKMKQTGVRLDAELLIKTVKHLAVDIDRSFAPLVSEAIEDLLEKYSKKGKQDRLPGYLLYLLVI